MAVDRTLVQPMLAVTIVLLLHGLLIPIPVVAQSITEALVRGSNVSILTAPDPDADRVAVVQRGDVLRITGNAVKVSGESKPITVETLGVTRDWFVPVEIVSTGEAGWIPEQFINSRGATTRPIEESALGSTITSSSTMMPTETVTDAPPNTRVPATQAPETFPTPMATSALSSLVATPVAESALWSKQTGLVTAATARNTGDCTDGVGSTLATDALFEAALSGNGDTILLDHQACVGGDPSGTHLFSQCSPEAEGPTKSKFVIYCRVEVTNAEDVPLSIGANQFRLASDSAVFPVDERLSAAVPAHVDIVSAPAEIGSAEDMIGMIGFVIPLDQRDQPFVLIWDGPDTEPAMILLAEREPSILEVLEVIPLGAAEWSEPIPTATPSFTDQWFADKEAEVAYIDAIVPIVEKVSQSLTRHTDLLESPRFGDATWEALLQDEVDIWISAYDEASALTPPEAFTDVHSEYLLGLSYMVDAGNEFMPAVRDLDAEGIERANALMQEATRHTLRALELLEEYDVLGMAAP